MRPVPFLLLLALLAAACTRADDAPQPPAKSGPPPAEGPLAYKAKGSDVVFYVESDRKHVAAVDGDGKVRWHKDVTQVVTLKTRGDRPARVVYVGKPNDWMVKSMRDRGKAGEYVGIGLSTKEFGLLDTATGEYTSMGND